MKRFTTFHNTLAWTRIRALLVAAMAVPGFLLAASPHAGAVTNAAPICEIHGNHYCIGAPTLGLYDQVKETPTGRDINIVPVPGGKVELQFAAKTSLCVAVANNGIGVVQHACSGGQNTSWISLGNAFVSTHGLYLSGANNGTQYEVQPELEPGWNQQFKVETHP